MEGFLQCCLQEINSQTESRELIEGLTRKLSAHASRVRELVSVPELAEEEVSHRVTVGLAADQPLEDNFFSGILEGVAGRLGLAPPGVPDPPASARVGVSRQWAAALREAVIKMEGRDINLGQVAHDVLPPRLHLDYDLDFQTRRVDDIAPTLTPSLLSSLVGNIRKLEKPEIPIKPIPFKAEEGLGGSGWVPPKPEASGPSRDAGETPQMPASKGEVPKSEPPDQGGSQRDQLLFELNPEEVAEVVISDDDDIDLTLEVPLAASTPVSEPARCRKRSPEDQDPHSSPSKKQATKEEGMSMPYQEKALPKGVRIEDILSKRYETLSGNNEWVHRVRCSLLGLEAGTTPSKEDINSSEWFAPQATAWETEQPEIITDHWLSILQEEGLLVDCPSDQFTPGPGWVPLYTKENLAKHLPAALSTFTGAGVPSLMAVVPPDFQVSTDREFLLTNFHRHGCLVRQLLNIEGRQRQMAFCPYCRVINENSNTALSHVRRHLNLLFMCGGCHTKSFPDRQALHKHMRYHCHSMMAIQDKPRSSRR